MIVTISKRLTHGYVGSCAHLDKWEDIGTAFLIEVSSGSTDTDDMCEPWLTEYRGMADAPGHSDDDVRRAIEDSLTRQGCAHEYDCCGCRSYSATAERDGNQWRVSVSSSRNF